MAILFRAARCTGSSWLVTRGAPESALCDLEFCAPPFFLAYGQASSEPRNCTPEAAFLCYDAYRLELKGGSGLGRRGQLPGGARPEMQADKGQVAVSQGTGPVSRNYEVKFHGPGTGLPGGERHHLRRSGTQRFLRGWSLSGSHESDRLSRGMDLPHFRR
ncbi:hypothetical protein MRX96_004400 [Rhipicephalus microplus]